MNAPKHITPCLFVLISCGGGQPAQGPSDVETGDGRDSTTPADEAQLSEAALSWADMNRDQRMEYMGLTVMPQMKKVFQESDPDGYADFECQTCHGADMKEVDYAMPNGLFPLTKPDPIPDAMEYDAEVTKFMQEQVVPTMASLLEMEPATEFGCFNCHEAEE